MSTYYTSLKHNHNNCGQNRKGLGHALSNSLQLFDFVYNGLRRTYVDAGGNIETLEVQEPPDINFNELFLDVSFLMRGNLINKVNPDEFPSWDTANELFKNALDIVGIDNQVMKIKSTYNFMKETYDNDCIVSLENIETRLEVIRLFLLFAIGRLHGGDVVSDQYPGLSYFRLVFSLLQDYYGAPTLAYVECLHLVTIYLIGLNKLDFAYMYSGNAVRVASLLRLNMITTYEDNHSQIEKERMKRLWWSVTNVDFFAASCLGTPALLPIEVVPDIDLPEDGKYGGELPTSFFLKEKIVLTKLKQKILTCASINSRNGLVANIDDILESLCERSRSITSETSKMLHFDDKKLFWRLLFALVFRLNECIILVTIQSFLRNIQPQTTRTISDKNSTNSPTSSNSLDFKLSNMCLAAAISNIRVYKLLSSRGDVSFFGFIDSNFLFLSAIVLMLTEYLDDNLKSRNTSLLLNDCTTIFRDLTNSGSVTANDHLIRLQKLRILLLQLNYTLEHPTTGKESIITVGARKDVCDDFDNSAFDYQSFEHFKLIENIALEKLR